MTDFNEKSEEKEEFSFRINSWQKNWNNGQVIKIKILNGSEYMRNRVRNSVAECLNYTNLKLVFIDVVSNNQVTFI